MQPVEDGIETNERGGKQAGSPYFLRGLPPQAILRIGRILKTGAATYEADPFGNVLTRNWHKITAEEHLEHLLTHATLHVAGDRQEDHASHLATRALFFLHQWLIENGETP